MNLKLGFIGAGNMAKAILEGLINNNVYMPDHINISDIDRVNSGKYAEKTGVNFCENNNSLVGNSDIIILAVKPNILPTVLEEIKTAAKDKLFISIVAGASISKISDILGKDCKIVRTMPNTPAMVSEGMTIISYGDLVKENDKTATERIFESIGRIEIMDERYLNSVIALTSSSPAYFFIMLEAMADAAVHAGIPRNISYKLAAQSMLGSAKMVLESGKHPAELKDMVCSPGGTTIEAVAELENSGFRNAVISAMKECTDKANRI